jgi:hypothetical protein
MAKKNMSKDVFEACVSSIAIHHLTTGKTIDELASIVWEGYAQDVADDNVALDLSAATKQSLSFLNETNSTEIAEFFNHFQFFCLNYDDLGKQKKKKIFNGLWFEKPEQTPHRVNDYLRKIKSYWVGAKSGLMPLAPSGWSMSNR